MYIAALLIPKTRTYLNVFKGRTKKQNQYIQTIFNNKKEYIIDIHINLNVSEDIMLNEKS